MDAQKIIRDLNRKVVRELQDRPDAADAGWVSARIKHYARHAVMAQMHINKIERENAK